MTIFAIFAKKPSAKVKFKSLVTDHTIIHPYYTPNSAGIINLDIFKTPLG